MFSLKDSYREIKNIKLKNINLLKPILIINLILILLNTTLYSINNHSNILILIISLILFIISIFFIITFNLFLKRIKELQHQSSNILELSMEYLDNFMKITDSIKEGDISITKEIGINKDSKIKEFDELINNLSVSLESIKSININSQKISLSLANSIKSLVETGNSQASASAEQASSIAQITATMEELAKTAAQIANNSNKVAEIANKSDEVLKDGIGSIYSVINSINNISDKMENISDKTNKIGQDSKEIAKIVDIIHKIANETHLLALNAAIESSAAGEFGKRFSVIASEVRRLAEISRDSAESIRSTIEDFQNSIDTTILTIDEGNKMTNKIKEDAYFATEKLNEIMNSFSSTVQSANEISIATQQQRSASDQIVLTLKDISQVTKQQAQDLKKSSKEIENIDKLALELQLLTQRIITDSEFSLGFKIKEMANNPAIYKMERKEINTIFKEILEENSFIELIFLSDKQGKIFDFHINRDTSNIEEDAIFHGKDASARPWFINSINSRNPYITNVYKSIFSNEDCFTISIGIFDEDDEFVGVLGMDINVKDWGNMKI